MRPASNYRYAVQPSTFTAAEEQGIHAAFANWQSANANTGLATTFSPVGWLDDRELTIVRGPMYPDDPNAPAPGAAIVDSFYGADWFLDSAGIVFDNIQQFAFMGGLGVRKGTRHEAGHLHALNDVDSSSAPSQSSVMLAPIMANDAGNVLPDYVTSCDADRAYQAQFLPGFP